MPYTNHFTAQLIEYCIRLTSKFATAISYLIYKYSTFLYHKVIRVLPNIKVP